MCHSPSGALSVQTPDLACWALADTTTASESPAASPPDTTFCATRFITNLRERVTLLLTSLVLPLRIGRAALSSYRESRPGPVLRKPTFKRCYALEARARLSGASTGETRSRYRNRYAYVGSAGWIGERDPRIVNWSREAGKVLEKPTVGKGLG